jgi:cytochrome c553
MNTLAKRMTTILLAGCVSTLPAWAADKASGQQKSAICAGCHAATGKSSNAEIPNLAAQQASYIVSQLQAFKSGTRHNPMMEPIAAGLNEADMENLAAYFASQAAVKADIDTAVANAAAKDASAKSTMCLGCHGETAAGNGQIPRLAGQQPDYIVKQLNAFKDGSRKNAQMKAIAATLPEQDIKALAVYFGSR